jgi:hypothetical protein
MARRSRALRNAGTVAMVALATSCGTASPRLTEAVLSALGGRDGYVFVVSPFNCVLGGNQIDALNAIGSRHRRSGVMIVSGGAAGNDSAAVAAAAGLGIRMRTTGLTGTHIERELKRMGWQPPLVVAVQRGEIVGLLRGEEVRRLDTWVAWLERQSLLQLSGEDR